MIVGPNVDAGATLISYYAFDDGGPPTIRLSGNRGGAFGIRPWGRVTEYQPWTANQTSSVSSIATDSMMLLAAPTGEIYVANPRALKPGSRFELKLIATDSQGVTTTQTLDVIIPDSTMTVTTAENASDGAILGNLPTDLSRPRMRTTVLTNSFERFVRNPWIADYLRTDDYGVGQPSPIRIEGGKIIASPSSKSELQVDGHDRRFNYEESQTTLQDGVRVSGHTLLQVFDRITRQTQYVVVKLQLTNVNERSSIAAQTVQVGLNGNSSLIQYNDPDDNQSNELHQMRIIGGDPDGIFEIKNGYPQVYMAQDSNSPFYVALKNPARVQSGQQYSLTVELLENGQSVGTAVLTVQVVENYFEILIWPMD